MKTEDFVFSQKRSVWSIFASDKIGFFNQKITLAIIGQNCLLGWVFTLFVSIQHHSYWSLLKRWGSIQIQILLQSEPGACMIGNFYRWRRTRTCKVHRTWCQTQPHILRHMHHAWFDPRCLFVPTETVQFALILSPLPFYPLRWIVCSWCRVSSCSFQKCHREHMRCSQMARSSNCVSSFFQSSIVAVRSWNFEFCSCTVLWN